ncbi:MAG TPA: signal peptidase I [Steroidobacteraceae bacterium]|nr:signal peptidase I [Steroidobacteraceae bacterium]
MAAKKRSSSPPPKKKSVVANARRGKAPSEPWLSRASLMSLLSAVGIFLFIRIFLIAAYHIPSESMEPTLLIGDFLFVDEVSYGAHIPFTNLRVPGFTAPKRGSIVVYESPYQRCIPNTACPFIPDDPTPVVVKRAVGVAGDTVHMRKGMLYVNGIAQRQGFGAGTAPLAPDDSSPYYAWQHEFEVRGSRFGAPPETPSHDNWGPLLVPAKHLLTMGDNRYQSVDGRYYGFAPLANVRGRPLFIYFSFDLQDWTFRWSRFFSLIH